MNLSICIITKNESVSLERCLRSFQSNDVELVVVDTGSTDNTREMAAQYTTKIYDFSWCDDFAAAKNYAIQKASHDMVMVVDSDEYIVNFDEKELALSLETHGNCVGRIRRINLLTRNGETQRMKEWVNRIFNRRFFHYEGRIHEQIVPGSVFEMENPVRSTNVDKYQTYQTSVEMEHDGYNGDEETRRQKAYRNINLLKKEYEHKPEDTYVIYQLGKGYYMAGDYEAAVHYFDIALTHDVDPKLEYVIDMVETYGYALLQLNRPDIAILLEGVYNEFGDSADFQFLMGLIYMNNAMFEQAVAEFMKATKHKDCRAEGVTSYLSYYNAGVIRECLGDVKGAKEFYRQCGNYLKAQKRLGKLDDTRVC